MVDFHTRLPITAHAQFENHMLIVWLLEWSLPNICSPAQEIFIIAPLPQILSLQDYIYLQNFTNSCINTPKDNRQNSRNKASKRQKLVFQHFLLTSAKTIKFQDGNRSTRIYTAVSLQQDEFRTNRFYFLPFTIPAFCRYAQNTVRPCSCRDQAVTQTHTHQKTTTTLRLRARC